VGIAVDGQPGSPVCGGADDFFFIIMVAGINFKGGFPPGTGPGQLIGINRQHQVRMTDNVDLVVVYRPYQSLGISIAHFRPGAPAQLGCQVGQSEKQGVTQFIRYIEGVQPGD
jgi:hypothetical protein